MNTPQGTKMNLTVSIGCSEAAGDTVLGFRSVVYESGQKSVDASEN